MRIAESAIWPRVRSVIAACASSAVANAWVAPSSIAFSRLFSSGSTATTFFAPAYRAPCTALMPMPPMPETITVWPGRTLAVLTAEPQPVGHAAADEHGLVQRQVVVDLDARSSGGSRRTG